MTFTVKGKVWKYPGFGGWHFFTIGKSISGRIKKLMQGQFRGFGSIRVKSQIGKSEWRTSIFPTKEGKYILPIKADIRKKEEISIDDIIRVQLTLFIL